MFFFLPGVAETILSDQKTAGFEKNDGRTECTRNQPLEFDSFETPFDQTNVAQSEAAGDTQVLAG